MGSLAVWQSGSRGCGNHQSGVDNGWNAELEYFVEHLEGANVATRTFWRSFEHYKDQLKSEMILSKILHRLIFKLLSAFFAKSLSQINSVNASNINNLGIFWL